jgi:hypothetical protein
MGQTSDCWGNVFLLAVARCEWIVHRYQKPERGSRMVEFVSDLSSGPQLLECRLISIHCM